MRRDRVLRRGHLVIDLDQIEVRVNGRVAALTRTEFRLLAALAARPGRVWERPALLEEVWPIAPDVGERSLDPHICRLRQKLGPVGRTIHTVRGFGYAFRNEEEPL